jgi:hypothetical protein
MVSLTWSSVSRRQMPCCYAHGSNNACKLQLLILFLFFLFLYLWCDIFSLLFVLFGICMVSKEVN